MNPHAENQFTKIYYTDTWNGYWQNRDGYGSSMEYTESIRASLPGLLKKYNIKSMLDASCGQYVWMRHVDIGDVRYIGGEIVKEKINVLKEEFPDKEWMQLDIIEDQLPKVDMWMCRDTIFHFAHKYVKQCLENFINSEIEYILISSHPGSENVDIPDFKDWTDPRGYFNCINFEVAPFNFPAPIDRIDDTGPNFPLKRDMLLYKRSDLANFDYFK